MYENTEKFIDLDFEQRVRQTAYHLWEDDGRPFGEEKKYWFMALEQLLGERSASEAGAGHTHPPTASAAPAGSRETQHVPPDMREPKGDHNRRVSLGMEPENFAAAAGVTVEQLRAYELTGPDQDFDLDVADRVGWALERLEAQPPRSQIVRN